MTKWERLLYICLAAVSIAALGLRVEERLNATKTALVVTNPTSARHADELKGRSLIIPGVRWSSSGTSAVLFINEKCRFCQASIPFYRELAEVHRRNTNGSVLFALSIDPPASTKQYLEREQIAVDGVYELPPSNEIGLVSTPTLLVLDKNGVVLRAYVGLLDNVRQQEVIGAMRTGRI